jgi:hypothetical protein
MESGDGRRWPVGQYALAGLETGTLACLGMLAWLGVSSMWYRRSFWATPNLLASTFYGESALRNRFTAHTLSGLALFLLIYGSIGIIFGLALQHRRGALLLGTGILEGVVSYYLVFGWLLKHWDPLIALYAQDRPIFASHVLYGAMLGYYARHLRRVWPASERAAPTPPDAEGNPVAAG